MIPRAVFIACLVALAGCVHPGRAPAPDPAAAGIPDDAIGLSKVDITEIPDPLRFTFVASDPGEAPLPQRAYPGAPPVVSHTMEDMLPITRSDNACIDCHEVEAKEPGEPTPIPEDHYVDLRNAPASRRDTIAGARVNCIACHVFQSDAPPLVQMDWP